MQTVISTATFHRQAKLLGIPSNIVDAMILAVSETPTAGDLIVGSGGARKVRYAKPGSGKSGGYRMVTYHAADDVPTLILDVYGKGQKVNLTKKEVNRLASTLAQYATAYRESSAQEVENLKRKA